MRLSTLAFLVLFAGMFGGLHRAKLSHECQAARDGTVTAHDSRRSAHGLEQELHSTERRFREAKNAQVSVERSMRQLQDLVRRTQKDLAESGDRAMQDARRRNCTQLESDLEEVRSGYLQLTAEIEHLDGQRAALRARLDLARAGIREPVGPAVDADAPARRTLPERPSPLEALGEVARIVAH